MSAILFINLVLVNGLQCDTSKRLLNGTYRISGAQFAVRLESGLEKGKDVRVQIISVCKKHYRVLTHLPPH
jgi:hypothetical protein